MVEHPLTSPFVEAMVSSLTLSSFVETMVSSPFLIVDLCNNFINYLPKVSMLDFFF